MIQQRGQWILRLLFVLSVTLVLAILARTNIVRGAGGRIFGFLERPFTVAGTHVAEQGEVVFASRSELIGSLEEKNSQIVALAQEVANREESRRQLDQALALLQYEESQGTDIVPARVMVRTQQYENERWLIDAGSQQGVQMNDPVVSGEGLLIGTVQEVFARSAQVAPLVNRESTIGATLLDTEGTLGIVQGAGDRLVEFGFVPQETDVSVNDVVVTSGIDPQIPRGLIIGVVNSVEEDPSAPFLHLFVEPLVDLNHTRLVGVITIR